MQTGMDAAAFTDTMAIVAGRPKGDTGPAMRRALLRELARLEKEGQPPPTTLELAAALDVEQRTIRHHLSKMQADGWITRRPRRTGVFLTPLGRTKAQD